MKLSYLVDTDWAIHYLNGQKRIRKRLEEYREVGVALSLISLAELYEGIYYSTDPEGNDGQPASAGQLQWYAQRVERTRELLESAFSQSHSLGSLSREAGMSPFHFARVFRQLTGAPPHRYLLRVRLAQAAQRLRQGASVTDTCYACGFNNLSHFIRLFRRSYGVSPSQFAS